MLNLVFSWLNDAKCPSIWRPLRVTSLQSANTLFVRDGRNAWLWHMGVCMDTSGSLLTLLIWSGFWEFLRTRLLPISSWGDSVLEKSTMGGTVVSASCFPLLWLISWSILWHFGRFYLFQRPTCKLFSLLSHPDPVWPLHPTPPLSQTYFVTLAHTHTSHKHSWVLWHQQHTCSHTFNFRLHSLWRPCPEEAWSHFFLRYTSLIFHYKFKHSSFTH